MSEAKRSLLRPRNIIGLALVGAAVWAAIAVTQRLTLTPGRAGKFNGDLTKLVEDAQASSVGAPNGWPILIEATDLVREVSHEWLDKDEPAGWPKDFSWPPSAGEAWEPDATPLVRDAHRGIIQADRERGVYGKLDALAASRRFIRPTATGRLMDLQCPELGGIREAARLCKGRMYFAALDHDGPEVVRAARHAVALARVCQSQPMLIDHLVGSAVNTLTAMTIRDGVRLGMFDAPTCRGLLELLNTQAAPYDPTIGLKAEHLSARDTVEWTHSDDGHGDGRLVPGAMPGIGPGGLSLERRAELLFQPTKKQTLEALDRFFTLADQEARTPLRARAGRPGPTANEFVESLGKRYALVQAIATAIDRYLLLADAEDLEISGAKLMLALELHKAAHGDFPEALAAMDPGLGSLGIRAAWSDEIRYRRFKAGEDPNNRPYLLYWIGIDGTDQGGKTLDDGTNQSAMAKAARGYDFVFNLAPKAPGGR